MDNNKKLAVILFITICPVTMGAIPWLVWYTVVDNAPFPWWLMCFTIPLFICTLQLSMHIARLYYLDESPSSYVTSNSQECHINYTNPEISHQYAGLTIQDNAYQQGYVPATTSYQGGYVPKTMYTVP